MGDIYFETERLLVRRWRTGDLADLHDLRSNQQVMRYFIKPQSLDEVQKTLASLITKQAKDGFAFGALIEKQSHMFCGFAGIAKVDFQTQFTPATEIGWSLLPQFWGMGLANEAARHWLNYAFEEKQLNEIVSFAVTGNKKSHQVMQRIGLKRDPDKDFDHPNVPPEKPEIIRHLTWSITRSDWANQNA